MNYINTENDFWNVLIFRSSSNTREFLHVSNRRVCPNISFVFFSLMDWTFVPPFFLASVFGMFKPFCEDGVQESECMSERFLMNNNEGLLCSRIENRESLYSFYIWNVSGL